MRNEAGGFMPILPTYTHSRTLMPNNNNLVLEIEITKRTKNSMAHCVHSHTGVYQQRKGGYMIVVFFFLLSFYLSQGRPEQGGNRIEPESLNRCKLLQSSYFFINSFRLNSELYIDQKMYARWEPNVVASFFSFFFFLFHGLGISRTHLECGALVHLNLFDAVSARRNNNNEWSRNETAE